jgi:hypothetical protein
MSRKRGKWVALKAKDYKSFDAGSTCDCAWARALKRAFPKATIQVGSGNPVIRGASGFKIDDITYALTKEVEKEYLRIFNTDSLGDGHGPLCRPIELYIPAPRKDGHNIVGRFRLTRKKAA